MSLLGTPASTWESWRESKGFPEPVWDAGQGALWLKEDLLDWRDERRLPPQARKLVRDAGIQEQEEQQAAIRPILDSLKRTARQNQNGAQDL